MNAVMIRKHLVSILNQYGYEGKTKYPWAVYEGIIDAIMNYYFYSGVNYDFDEARATFLHFLKTGELCFDPI